MLYDWCFPGVKISITTHSGFNLTRVFCVSIVEIFARETLTCNILIYSPITFEIKKTNFKWKSLKILQKNKIKTNQWNHEQVSWEVQNFLFIFFKVNGSFTKKILPSLVLNERFDWLTLSQVNKGENGYLVQVARFEQSHCTIQHESWKLTEATE